MAGRHLRSIALAVAVGIGSTLLAHSEEAYVFGQIPQLVITPGKEASLTILPGSGGCKPEWSVKLEPGSPVQAAVEPSTNRLKISAASVAVARQEFALTQKCGEDIQQQLLAVIPVPSSDFQVMLAKRPIPSPASYDYTTVVDRTSATPTEFNHGRRALRDVHIIGRHVEIGANVTSNTIYERLDNQLNIQTLVIEAERIVFSSALRVPQTAVTLRAREIVFESAGSIVTTPRNLNECQRPKQMDCRACRAEA